MKYVFMIEKVSHRELWKNIVRNIEDPYLPQIGTLKHARILDLYRETMRVVTLDFASLLSMVKWLQISLFLIRKSAIPNFSYFNIFDFWRNFFDFYYAMSQHLLRVILLKYILQE